MSSSAWQGQVNGHGERRQVVRGVGFANSNSVDGVDTVIYGSREYANISFEFDNHKILCSRQILELHINPEQWCVSMDDPSSLATIPVPANIQHKYLDGLIAHMYDITMPKTFWKIDPADPEYADVDDVSEANNVDVSKLAVNDQAEANFIIDVGKLMDAADWLSMKIPFIRVARAITKTYNIDQMVMHSDLISNYTSDRKFMTRVLAIPDVRKLLKKFSRAQANGIIERVAREVPDDVLESVSKLKFAQHKKSLADKNFSDFPVFYTVLKIRGDLRYINFVCRNTYINSEVQEFVIYEMLHTSNDDIICFGDRVLYTKMREQIPSERIISFEMSDKLAAYGELTMICKQMNAPNVHNEPNLDFNASHCCMTLSGKPVLVKFTEPVGRNPRFPQYQLMITHATVQYL